MASPQSRRPDTLIQHFAEHEKTQNAVVAPLFQNSTFVYPSFEEFWGAWSAEAGGPPYIYSRMANPSLDTLERKIAAMEGTERAKMLGSGMAALTAAVLSCVSSGGHVVCVDTVYGSSRHLFDRYLTRYGVETTYVDGRTAESVLDAVRPETQLIYLESPSSLVFYLQDLEAVCRAAREKGIPTLIDNTYATPLNQNPAAFGVDIVVHSATKYINGHSDLTAGVVCASASRIDALTKAEVNLMGSILSPFAGWLVLRGLRTLPLRLKRVESTANIVAEWLSRHPRVERVMHLGLPSYPQRELFEKQMRGASGVFSFVPKNQDRAYVARFVDALRLFGLGVSWGGHESLVISMPIQPMGWPQPTYIVRLSCGLEDPQDLVDDLAQAFAVADAG
ncbi:MAG: PLP-dependent aspartate aminotransferase family protein [Fimbriimonadaceae bacterium]